jgi:predicted ATPase/Flp pilus assembly protein TadD
MSAHPHNLPPQSTPFINRTHETGDIHQLITSQACRILTILGPGGMGKTRLALQVAAEHVESFPNGVFHVPLAAINSAEFLIPTIADALKFQFYSEKDPKQQLLDYLRHKEILLILDNFEHVVAEAMLLAELIDVAPRLKIIVTSRERLNLQAERIYEIGGLGSGGESKTDSDEMSATMLFLYIAQKTDPSFTLNKETYPSIQKICKLLGGLPLGIELAAGLTRVISPVEIARGLEKDLKSLAGTFRDMPERHRSLKSAFEYSWRMLDPDLQRCFARLSIFRGGFEREAAEEVTGASIADLTMLMDKSLLRRNTDGRYEILEVLRHFAESYLDEAEKNQALGKYCEYYSDLLATNELELYGKEQMQSLELLGREIENLRNAWSLMIVLSRYDLLAKSAHCLFYCYIIKCRYEEARKLLETAYSSLTTDSKSNGDEAERQKAVMRIGRQLGRIYFVMREKTQAAKVLAETTELARSIGDAKEEAYCLLWLGALEKQNEDFEKAEVLLKQSLQLFEKQKDDIGIASVLIKLGNVASLTGKYDDAQEYFLNSLAIAKKYGDKISSIEVLNSLMELLYKKGNYQAAKKIGGEALQIARDIDSKNHISVCLLHLGSIAYSQGNLDEARSMFIDSLVIGQEIGEKASIKSALNNLAGIAVQQNDLIEARRLLLEFLEIQKEIGQLRGVAAAFHNLGHVELMVNNIDEAEKYILESLAIRKRINDLPGVASSLINLSTLELEKKEIKKSIDSTMEALKLALQMKALPLILRCLTNCAQILSYMNQHKDAIRIYKTLFVRAETPQEIKTMATEKMAGIETILDTNKIKELDEIKPESNLDVLVAATVKLMEQLAGKSFT